MHKNVIKYSGTLNMKHASEDGSYTLKKSEEKSKKKSFYITASKYFNDFRDYHFDCFTDMYIFLANDYKAY